MRNKKNTKIWVAEVETWIYFQSNRKEKKNGKKKQQMKWRVRIKRGFHNQRLVEIWFLEQGVNKSGGEWNQNDHYIS